MYHTEIPGTSYKGLLSRTHAIHSVKFPLVAQSLLHRESDKENKAGKVLRRHDERYFWHQMVRSGWPISIPTIRNEKADTLSSL
jgi:hypothetical protein